MRCSRGTYIRSLAADIGDALGSGAHLTSLVRTRSGPFELRDSVRLEEIQADPQSALRKIRSVDEVLSSMPVIVITDLGRRRFLNGVPVIRSEVVRYGNEFRVGDMIRVHDEAGMLLGIGEATVTCNPLAGPNAEDPGATICKAVRVLGQA